MPESINLPDNVFRANAGAVIINSEGYVLAFERLKIPGAWQLPQGGINVEEELLDAVKRELFEEARIEADKLQFLGEYPEWLVYELDKDKRKPKHGRGQAQKWFLFRFVGNDQDIDVVNVENREFSSWKWTSLHQLAQEVVAFRQKIYQKLILGFSEHLK